jgi:hypothetical protein
MKIEPSSSIEQNQAFVKALRKVVRASPTSVRAAISESKAGKPSQVERFSYAPVKARE